VRSLGPFPRSIPPPPDKRNGESRGKAERQFDALHQRWQAAEHEPLHIVGRLATGFVPAVDGALHLDSLLSAAAFTVHGGAKMCDTESFVLPLPLALIWVSGRGRPLWAATDLRPVGAVRDGVAYLHSRYPDHRSDLAIPRSTVTSAGPFKDVRLPLLIRVTADIEAWCIGIKDDIETLLAAVTNVGRKSAHGRGRVLSWTVEPAPGIDAAWILERRMTPLEALGGAAVPACRIAPRIGWTPPYWDARLHAACRRPAW
jgi:hypothetical protein